VTENYSASILQRNILPEETIMRPFLTDTPKSTTTEEHNDHINRKLFAFWYVN